MVYVHVKEKNAEEIKKYCSEIGEINNLPVAFNNRYFRYVNQMISADQLGILGILNWTRFDRKLYCYKKHFPNFYN